MGNLLSNLTDEQELEDVKLFAEFLGYGELLDDKPKVHDRGYFLSDEDEEISSDEITLDQQLMYRIQNILERDYAYSIIIKSSRTGASIEVYSRYDQIRVQLALVTATRYEVTYIGLKLLLSAKHILKADKKDYENSGTCNLH